MKPIILIPFLVLTACANRQTKYQITSRGVPAQVEVNGQLRCRETPCEINLVCTKGPLAIDGKQDFIAAYPNATDGENYPQYVMAERCVSKKEQPKTIEFDLSKETDPKSFSYESQLERSKLNFFAVSLTQFEYSPEPSYRMTGLGAEYGWLFSMNNYFKFWTKLGGYTFSGKYLKDKDNFDPRAFEIHNLYQVHPRLAEWLFVSGGPMLMVQSHGNSDSVFGIYVGFGVLMSSVINQYRYIPELEVGNTRFDISLGYGGLLASTTFGAFTANFIVYW